MKKNLLRMIGVREFSAQVEFRDPCLSFVLRDVICSYCNDCCDLDICRNADIQVGLRAGPCRIASDPQISILAVIGAGGEMGLPNA